MPSWDPDQYLKFSDHRLRPALDLMAQIALAAPRSIYDLGCGPGTITRLLAERWPEAAVTGIDSSADMLAKARQEAPRAEARIDAVRAEARIDAVRAEARIDAVRAEARIDAVRAEARIDAVRAEARMEAAQVAFEQADIARWSPPVPADLLFTDATLHWLDDHAALL